MKATWFRSVSGGVRIQSSAAMPAITSWIQPPANVTHRRSERLSKVQASLTLQ